MAHRPTDKGPSTNIEEIACACIGARAPSSGRVLAKETESALVPPGCGRFTHRTETLDYIIMLSGEIDLELGSGEVAHLKSGDVLLNRGMIHTWVNNGSLPAVMAVTMIDAKPVEINGKVLRTEYPSQQKAAKQ